MTIRDLIAEVRRLDAAGTEGPWEVGHYPGCRRRVAPGGHYWRLHGMAHRGDKPYVMRECEVCHTHSEAHGGRVER